MIQGFLIKYAEIGIKGKNRYKFENALCGQIKIKLSKIDGDFTVVREQGRIYTEASGGFDTDEVITALQRVPGISGISPVEVIEDKSFENIKKAAGDFIEKQYEDINFTFKVRAKRSDKHYQYTSPEICMEMGAYLLGRFEGLKVDVHNPGVYIWIEIRDKAYIYSKVYKGTGGMPLGTGGRAMLLLSGGIDSPVAGYMVSRRGVIIDAVYFHAPPYTSERAKQKVISLAKIVSRYSGKIRLHVVDFTAIQMYIYEKCPHEELTIIMRRYMMRIAEELAVNNGCIGLITGESIGQVASQTMQSLAVTNEVCHLPVYRPLIAFDKQDIVNIAEKLGTFEVSIQPYEDCCTIFVAKHPVTKPVAEVIRESEKKLAEEIDGMVKAALETVEITDIDE